jgi:hypothetical protein
VNRVLASLPNKKALELDGILNKVLKTLIEEISIGIARDINNSLKRRILLVYYRESTTITL